MDFLEDGPGDPKPIVTHDDAEYKAWLASKAGPTHDDAEFQQWKASQPKPVAPRSTFYNAVNTVDNALTFGLGQKFNAAWNAAGDAVRGRDSFGHSFNANLDAEHQGLDKFRNEHPIASGVASGIGGAAGVAASVPFAAAGEVANGLSMGARAAGAAKMGGALGAIGALGNAPNTGGVGTQLVRAGVGGAVGAALGAGMVPASQIIGAAAQKVGRNVVAPAMNKLVVADGGSAIAARLAPDLYGPAANGTTAAQVGMEQPLDRASKMLIERMQRAGMTPSDAMSRAEAIPADKPVSVMELAGDQSHPVRLLGKWVARTPSTGQAELRAAVAERSNPLPNAQRVLSDVGEAVGARRRNVVVQLDKMKAQQQADAKPFYDVAFDPEQTPPVPLDARVGDGPSVRELFKRPSIKGAVKFHNDIAAERGEEPLTLPNVDTSAPAAPDTPLTADDHAMYQRLSQMNGANEDATTQAMQQLGYTKDAIASLRGENAAPANGPQDVSLKTLQKLKFKLDDALGFAKRNNGMLPDGTSATKAKLGAINDTRRALVDIMDNHSQSFAQGNDIWGGHAAHQNALDEGGDFLSRPISELQSAYPKMTPAEQQQHNAGAVSGPIRDRLYAGNAIDRAKTLSSPDIQERLQVVTTPEKLAELQRKSAIEHEIALTNQQIPNGSDTYENAANDADANGQMAKSIVGGIMGRPRSALRAVVNGVVQPAIDSWVHGVNEQTANALAPKLSAGMMSREELTAMLNDLANKHAALMRTRPTPRMLGSSVGASIKLPWQGDQ